MHSVENNNLKYHKIEEQYTQELRPVQNLDPEQSYENYSNLTFWICFVLVTLTFNITSHTQQIEQFVKCG